MAKIKALLAAVCFLHLLSCTPSAPYEIKSPCVAIESDAATPASPCIRRPANFKRDII